MKGKTYLHLMSSFCINQFVKIHRTLISHKQRYKGPMNFIDFDLLLTLYHINNSNLDNN